MRYTAVAWLLLTTLCIGAAQQERLVVRTFNGKEGLPGNDVTAVFIDEEDRVWAGTPRGLFLSSGGRFSSAEEYSPFSYNELADRVSALADGGPNLLILVAGEHGLAQAIYRSPFSAQLSCEPVFPDVPPDSLSNITFTAALHTSQGEVVYGTNGHGLWVRSSGYMTRIAYSDYERPNFRFTTLLRILPGRDVTSLVERSDGEMWVGTTTGLVRYRVGRWESPLIGYASLSTASIAALHEDRSGSLWVGTRHGSVYRADRNAVSLVPMPAAWRGEVISAIASRANGDVWIGSSSNGLLRIRGRRWKGFSAADGLPSPEVRSAHVDVSDHLWVSTDNGLSVVSPEPWLDYTTADGLPSGGFTSGFVTPSGELMFGGVGAVARIRDGRVTSIRIPGANGRKQVHSIVAESGGDLWLMMQDGVVHQHDGRDQTYSFDRSWDPSVLQLIQHPSGGVLVRNPRCIVHLRRGRIDTVFVAPGGDRVDFMTVAQNGDIYAIYWDQPGIVYRIQHGRIERAWARYPAEFAPDAASTMFLVERANGYVKADDLPWTAEPLVGEVDWSNYPHYSNGIILRSGKKFLFSSPFSLTFTEPAIIAPGSADSVIRTGTNPGNPVLELSNENVLCFGGTGFALFDPHRKTYAVHELLNRVALGLMEEERAFRSLSGGASTLIKRRRQVLEDRDGNLWFAHAYGIGVVPRTVGRTAQAMPIIPSIRSGDEWYVPSNYSYYGTIYAVSRNADEVRGRALVSFDSTSPIRIRPRTNELVFNVVTPASLKDGSVTTQYTLDPGVPEWIPASADGTVRLIGLAPGSYRLRVRSIGATAPPSVPRLLQFTLELPFWNSAWFFVLAGVTGLYGAFVAYEKRVALLRDRHRRETEEAVQQNELRMARTLQLGMLPKDCPKIAGFDIAARMIPASDVGGDFYDFLSDDDETRIVIGDVSGHGLTGAMVVGMARTAVRFATSAVTGIAKVLALANDRLREDVSKNVFIAMMYGVLQPRRRRLRYVCAGQPTPILVREGRAAFLPTGKGDRFPLGMLIGVRYREETLTLRPGDLLLLYTDGVVEAMNDRKEEFGFERLQRALVHLQHASAAAVIDGLLASVESYTDRSRQDDDITLIAVKVTDGGVS